MSRPLLSWIARCPIYNHLPCRKDRLKTSLSGVSSLFSPALARSASFYVYCYHVSLTAVFTIMYLARKNRPELSLSGVSSLFSLALARSANHHIHCHRESPTAVSTIIYLAIKTGWNPFQRSHPSILALNWRAFVSATIVNSSLPCPKIIYLARKN